MMIIKKKVPKILHFGSEQPDAEKSHHVLSHELPKNEHSWAAERAAEQLSTPAKRAVQSKQVSKQCYQMSEYPSIYVLVFGCTEP